MPPAMKHAWRTIRNDEGGFTMVELITVLVLVGVVLSMAGPSMSTWLERTRGRQALDRVVADVSFARLYAVQSGRRTAIRLLSDGAYTIDTLSTSGSWAPLRTVQLRNDYSNVSIRSAVTALEFTSRGILTGQTGEAILSIALGEYGDSVFVSPAGRIYRDF